MLWSAMNKYKHSVIFIFNDARLFPEDGESVKNETLFVSLTKEGETVCEKNCPSIFQPLL